MSIASALRSLCAGLFGMPQASEEVDEELQSHIAHRADDLIVSFMADQDDRVAFSGVLDGLKMDLGDKRAGRVDRDQVALGGLFADLRRNSVR